MDLLTVGEHARQIHRFAVGAGAESAGGFDGVLDSGSRFQGDHRGIVHRPGDVDDHLPVRLGALRRGGSFLALGCSHRPCGRFRTRLPRFGPALGRSRRWTGGGDLTAVAAAGARRLLRRGPEEEEGENEDADRGDAERREHGQPHSAGFDGFLVTGGICGIDVARHPTAALGAGAQEAGETIIRRHSHGPRVGTGVTTGL